MHKPQSYWYLVNNYLLNNNIGKHLICVPTFFMDLFVKKYCINLTLICKKVQFSFWLQLLVIVILQSTLWPKKYKKSSWFEEVTVISTIINLSNYIIFIKTHQCKSVFKTKRGTSLPWSGFWFIFKIINFFDFSILRLHLKNCCHGCTIFNKIIKKKFAIFEKITFYYKYH